MRISNIGFNSSIGRTLKQTTNKQNNVPFKGVGFYNVQPDIFTIANPDRKYSEEFKKLVDDSAAREMIEKRVLLDNNGDFSKSNEKLFVDTLKDSFNYITGLGYRIGEVQYPYLVKSATEVLELIRKEDGTFNTKENNVPYLTYLIYASNTEGNQKLKEVLDYCKDEDSSVDTYVAVTALEYSTARMETITPEECALEIQKFCANSEGEIERENATAIALLLNSVAAMDIYDATKTFNLVKNKGQNEINVDKFEFVIEAFESLFTTFNAEYNVTDMQTLDMARESAISVVKHLIEEATDEDGNFDKTKAEDTFEAWTDYVKKEKTSLNDKIKITISTYSINADSVQPEDRKETLSKAIALSPQIKNSVYNTSLYRLERLFTNGAEPIDVKEYKEEELEPSEILN